MGKQREKPKPKNIDGYPAAGLNENYSGLCNFDCNLGYCPEGVCDTVPGPLTTPSVSPFSPTACTSGSGPGNYGGLCSYACTFGFCPRNICTCDGTGALVDTPPLVDKVVGSPVQGTDDYGLCAFACPRGYCPEAACVSTESNGGGGSMGGPPVSIDPSIWHDPTPIVSCLPPCVVILPPYTLTDKTTIEFPPVTKTFTEMWDEYTTATTVVTITFPPVTTTEIPVFNLNITNSGVDDITFTITPSILPTAKITFKPKASPTTASSQTPVVIIFTSTPAGSTTVPVIKDQPTKVRFTNTGPPGPTCTAGCGKACQINCSSCGVFGCGGICAGCGPEWTIEGGHTGGNQGYCIGPICQTKPPGYGVCQKDVVTTTGLCSNGNYPVWEPVTSSVSCEYTADQAPSVMDQCQKDIDSDLEKSILEAGESSSCCPLARRRSPLERRACVDPDYPNNPPANGLYHEVFICDYSKWPNVCANAQSAIAHRGKPDILTYTPNGRIGVMEKIPDVWYNGKAESGPGTHLYPAANFFVQRGDGWGLNGCQVEEYPFGSGNPNRNPDLKRWNDQAVLRLIPTTENQNHGNFLHEWYKGFGNGKSNLAKGLIYSVSFVNGPTGNTEADLFVDPDKEDEAKRVNICARPYGLPFIFVNSAIVYPGERSYDPWWDQRLFDKTTRIERNRKGATVKVVTAKAVSNYCMFPSPGKSYWDAAANAWQPHPNGARYDRKRSNKYYSCDNYPGYSGPAMMRRQERRGRRGLTELTPSEVQEMSRQGYNITVSDGNLGLDDEDEDEGPELMVIPSPISQYPVGAPPPTSTDRNATWSRELQALTPRQVAAGSFLDPSAFLYLGCGDEYADGDSCAMREDCGQWIEPPGADDEDPPVDDEPIPTPEPTPTPEPAPAPVPHADCAFWDSGLMWQFEIYNIQNWAADGGKKLKEEESGCGLITGWDWEEASGTRAPQVHFYLPFLMKAGCVERAIVSAGGPKISCEPSGIGLESTSLRLQALSPVALAESSGTPTTEPPTTKTVVLVAASPMTLPVAYQEALKNPVPHAMYTPMMWTVENAPSVA